METIHVFHNADDSVLAGCKRCPECYLLPSMDFKNGVWYLDCHVDGHHAQSEDLKNAVSNWNRYIAFVIAEKSGVL